jgi:hypothetical protein
MNLLRLKRVVVGVVLLMVGSVVFAACGATTPPVVKKLPSPTPSISVASAVLKPFPPPDAPASPASALNGIAQLELLDHTLIVTVSMIGLPAKTLYRSEIFEGTCVARGKTVYQLKPLTAGEQGIGNAKTSFKGVSALPDQHWSVLVRSPHNARLVLACGQVLLSR